MTSAGRRRAILAGAALLWIVVARLWFGALTAPQATWTDVDSQVFLEIAAQPAAVDHLGYPKPWTAPAAYRLVDAEPGRIVTLQRELAFFAWTVLGVALVVLQRRTATRVAAALVALVLLVAPARVGFTGAILSESIADSLLALVV
ncbi:MAG: hypothetical protein K8M05_15700, partial [Deltaproteobacteria bacterium]|nr:hypothetical protein [Kofleriaceae bacterium]